MSFAASPATDVAARPVTAPASPRPDSRIYEILPQRIQQWQQSPCVAEEMGRRQLERIRKEQQAARLRLALMEKRFHELEGVIAAAKQQHVQQHEEVRGGGTGRDGSAWPSL